MKETDIKTQNTENLSIRKRIPQMIGIAVIALIAIIVLIVWNERGEKDSDVREKKIGKEDTQYETYSNDTACFSVDYPKDYMVTEPESNNVVITDGEEADFQVVIEYAYSTTKNSMIYSAKDFDDQISTNPEVLESWIGSEDVRVTAFKQGKIAGRDCYEYDFELQIEGNPHTGQLFVTDGDGEFGCYSFMSVINEEAEDVKLYKEQSSAMKESFKITGSHQQEGYTIYNYDRSDLQFMVRDEAMGKTKTSGSSIVVYPVDGIFTQASIWIESTSYEENSKDAEEVLRAGCEYTLSHNEQGKYTSEPGTLECGRHEYTGVDAEYYDNGERYTLSVFTFVHDGKYWRIKMKSTDEYYETASKAVSDILFSLRFDGEVSAAASDKPKTLNTTSAEGQELDSIAAIESEEGYVSDSSWKPLAVTTDFNGDKVQEFLAIYEVKSGAVINVMYDVWSLQKSGAVKLKSEVLFKEVGGNSGVVGIVEAGGKPYLAVCRYEPQGEQFNNYYIYYPWETDKSALGESAVYLENHGMYGQEEKGKYILGNTTVKKSKFDARYKELSNWVYRLDLLAGAGDDGVMTFEDMKNK